MRKMLLSAFLLFSLAAYPQNAANRFDGNWDTTVTCDASGSTLAYSWHFTSTVAKNVLHGEKGTEGEPAYLAIDGKINQDGSAKLKATGVTGSSQYTHGPMVKSGNDYDYEVKSQFTDTEGKGERSTGLGIYGRPCHYVFEMQAPADAGQKP